MRPATIAEAPGSAGCAPVLFGKRGEPQRPSAFTAMGRRRVRWRNVARLACLLAAGALLAKHGPEAPAPRPATPRRELAPAPRLADVPRLWQPKRRKRRALKGKRPGLGPYTVHYLGRSPPRPEPQTPSPQSAEVGQAGRMERSAPRSTPTSGEFTPDPGP